MKRVSKVWYKHLQPGKLFFFFPFFFLSDLQFLKRPSQMVKYLNKHYIVKFKNKLLTSKWEVHLGCQHLGVGPSTLKGFPFIIHMTHGDQYDTFIFFLPSISAILHAQLPQPFECLCHKSNYQLMHLIFYCCIFYFRFPINLCFLRHVYSYWSLSKKRDPSILKTIIHAFHPRKCLVISFAVTFNYIHMYQKNVIFIIFY